MIIASAVALVSALVGVPPWLQVILLCAVIIVYSVILAWRPAQTRLADQCALVISRTHDGRDGVILYRGKYFTASIGCRCAVLPPCGAVVQVMACENGHCTVCPQ